MFNDWRGFVNSGCGHMQSRAVEWRRLWVLGGKEAAGYVGRGNCRDQKSRLEDDCWHRPERREDGYRDKLDRDFLLRWDLRIQVTTWK